MPQLTPLETGDEQRIITRMTHLLARPSTERRDASDCPVEIDEGHRLGGSEGARRASRLTTVGTLPTDLLHDRMLATTSDDDRDADRTTPARWLHAQTWQASQRYTALLPIRTFDTTDLQRRQARPSRS